MAGDSWQKIDTAPKDGTTVLLWSPDAHGDGIMFGFWGKFEGERVGDWIALTSAGEPLNIDAAPTHWLALPEPPK